jgi:pyruvate dehydrogenase E1 component
MSKQDHSVWDEDIDIQEVQDWESALADVISRKDKNRAYFLLVHLASKLRASGLSESIDINTAYINTIPPQKEAKMPDYGSVVKKASAMIRWHAVAMVVAAGQKASELGGHLATYASIASIYDIAFDHFLKGQDHGPGDLVFFQGHASPGNYARAYMEGRLTKNQLDHFRQESLQAGLSSYPHPWLMPDFWQFPTVSMGLTMMQAIYQARFMKYMARRELIEGANERRVWAFCGDGEMDEPESMGALALAAKEGLDNLIVVVNCNLQRLDGLVHGNGKIVQVLEGAFRGAGWRVIKSLWNSHWDPLFARDSSGRLAAALSRVVDGNMQHVSRSGASFLKDHIFAHDDQLKELFSDLSEDELNHLGYAGHDPQKIYAALHEAVHGEGTQRPQPTVVLIQSVKGYGLGEHGASNTTHSHKKLSGDELIALAKRLEIPLSDKQAAEAACLDPKRDAPEVQDYLLKRRQALGGCVPRRMNGKGMLTIPDQSIFQPLFDGSGDREISTTMAFVRALSVLLKDKALSPHIVPIVPDESRTFGMEGLFRQIGIYAPFGQQYEPIDRKQVMYYRESESGQYLQEGITEGGAFSSWMAAATSASNHDVPMIPFYIYYSMFGFQRIGDYAWAAGDARCRGFLLGATAGRTTLAGEGLQHDDGHSHVLSATIPNCISYDPAYGYELAVILHEGMQRMYVRNESVFYYITVMNENYVHPTMPEGVTADIIKGMYCLRPHQNKKSELCVRLLGSGALLPEVEKAADLLRADEGIDASVFSVTSYTELSREALSFARSAMRQPKAKRQIPHITRCLGEEKDTPVIAVTDYMRMLAEQIRPYVLGDYCVLGTDGFGRSDTRKRLRAFFEVNASSIAYAAIWRLHQAGKITEDRLIKAHKRYGIQSDKPNPWDV